MLRDAAVDDYSRNAASYIDFLMFAADRLGVSLEVVEAISFYSLWLQSEESDA